MYCDFFGLRCRPFEDRADTDFYFTTPEHEEAFASIEYEARYGHGMALLVGEPGTGKTLLVRTLLRKLSTSDRAVVLTWPASGQGDLVREVCKGFGISLPASHQSSRLATRFSRHLKRSHQAGHRSVLVIDQAENLTKQNLAELETISEAQRDGESPLSIILSATPRFRDLLGRDEFGRLRQKLFGERFVGPLTLEQTGAYITHRLRIAGAGERQPFSPDAIGPIHEASKGIPRLINRICDAAMVATYGAGNSTIDGAVAAEVALNECGIERSVDARKLGLDQADLGVSGWPSDGGGSSIASPQPPRSDSDRSQVEEWGEPHVDFGAAPRDFRGDPSHASAPTLEPHAGLGIASATAVAQSVPRPPAPSSGEADVLIARLTRATARAERAGATTEASIAQHSAIEKHLNVLNADAERLTGRLVETARAAKSSLDAMQQGLAAADEAAEETATGMDEKVSQASHVASELQQQIAGVNEACRKGDRVQSQLTAFADELADKGHGVQERMTRLMASVESGDAAQRGLAELIERASTIADETTAGLTRTVAELEQRIETVGRDATSRSRDAEEKLERALDRTSSRISDAQQQVGDLARTASDIAAETEQGLQRSTAAFENAKQKARQFEEELQRASVERCRTRVSDVRQQVDALVRTASDIATETEQGLQRSTAAFENVKQDAHAFEKEFLNTTLERCKGVVEKQLSQQIETQIKSGQESIETVLNRAAAVAGDADRAVGAIDKKFQEKMAEVEQCIEAFAAKAIDACTMKAQARLDAQLQAAEERVTANCAEIDARLAGYERSTADMLTAMTASTQKIEGRVNDLGVRRDELGSTLASLTSAVDKASVRASGIEETVNAASASVDQLVTRAEAAQAGLVRVVPETEHLIGEARAVRKQLETLQHAAASTLVDVGRAHEKLASVAQQTDKSQQLIGQLSSERDACESTARKLKDHAQNAEQLIHRASEMESQRAQQATALESRLDTAQSLLDELSRTCTIAKSTDEGISSAVRRAEDVTQQADRHRSRIETLLASGRNLHEELDQIVEAGTQLHDAMQGIVAHTDDKIARLDSHQAAASHVATKLSDMTVTGRALLDELIESKRGSEETSERIERMTTDAWDVGSVAETRLKALSETSGTAKDLLETLQKALQPVQSAMTGLIEGTAKAKQEVVALDQRRTEAQGLAERIGGITTILDSARKSEQSIKATHEVATETLARLAEGNEAATARVDTLRSLNDAANHMQQQSEASATKAEDAAARLVAHLGAVEKAVESGTPLLDDFVEQTRGLEKVLGSLDSRCAQIEERFTTATKKPAEIVATAQAQSAQLERVCQAVRKIFSGLSKATLEARKQINDSRTTNESTSSRMRQLTSETQRASNTLHEWVQEAVRVQSRLEGTLRRAPTIAETHPADALRAMSRLTVETPESGDSCEAETAHPASVAPTSPSVASTSETATESAGHRADEVAQLIEDAKRTANAPAN